MGFNRLFFILILALTLSGEGMLTVTLTWTILDNGGSVINLGIILSLMSILPFLIQNYSKKLRGLITNSPLLIFGICRSIGIIVVIFSLANSKYIGLNSLYVFAGIFSIILFLSTQSLETFMSQLVLDGKLTANKASNLLQTSIQIGAFGGNAIAGFLLSIGGFVYVLYALLVSLGAGIFVSFFKKSLSASNITPVSTSKTDVTNNHKQLKSNSIVLTLSVIAVGILTIQLSSFNFLIPILFHDVYKWEPDQYGLVSSAAGVGALLATLIGKYEKYIPGNIFILIVFIDLTLGMVNSWYLSIFCALALGFVFNRSRIFQRQIMFENIYTKEETSIWAGRSTVVFQVTKSILPLCLSFLLEWIGNMNSGKMLGSVGIFVTLCLLIIYSYERKYSKVVRKQSVTPVTKM